MRKQVGAQYAALMVCLAPVAAAASADDNALREKAQAEFRAAEQAANAAAISGPRDIKLVDQGVLHLPADEIFVPMPEADRFMVALGNSSSPRRVGLIMPKAKDANWLAPLTWIKEGHVPDTDAKEWQPDAMLDNLKSGTEEQNKDRVARGFPAIAIKGWVEPPAYDAQTHRLIWSLSSAPLGADPRQALGINYNTYALGREGYFSLDMITDSTAVAQDKVTAKNLLADIDYASGKRYQDFNPSTDKVAEYGLAALVGAVAIKKLGLLAVIGVFVLKIWKIALFVMLGGWAAVKRWFGKVLGRRGATDQAVDASEAHDDPPAWTPYDPEPPAAPIVPHDDGPAPHQG